MSPITVYDFPSKEMSFSFKIFAFINLLNKKNSPKNRFKLTKYQVDDSDKISYANHQSVYKKTSFSSDNAPAKFQELFRLIINKMMSNILLDVRLIPVHPKEFQWGFEPQLMIYKP